jgi:putative transposase
VRRFIAAFAAAIHRGILIHMHKWPHAPSHEVSCAGTYIVTAATHNKLHLFRDPADLNLVHDKLLEVAERFGWRLEAWAVFSNHYHFVGHCADESRLAELTKLLHGSTAFELNKRHQTPGRKVWFQYWQTRLTYERSYLARLNYVHHNPVKHRLVADARLYRWCSAKWFEEGCTPAFVESVRSFPTDKLNVPDEF